MRLIVEYTCTDGYTYWSTVAVPVVHESPEAFIVEFEEKHAKAWLEGNEHFTVGAQEFDVESFIERGDDGSFTYVSLRIMTVDEFFETVEK